MEHLNIAGNCAGLPANETKHDRTLTPEEKARYDNPGPSIDDVMREFDRLPPLTPKRRAWLQRKNIAFDEGANKLYELPAMHRFTEVDEPAIAFIIYDRHGAPVDAAWLFPRYPDMPRRGRLCGKATFINEAAITARPYTKDRPLHCWWGAWGWLKAGRIGIVILDALEAHALADVPWLCAESFRHAESAFDWNWSGHGSRVLIPKRIGT